MTPKPAGTRAVRKKTDSKKRRPVTSEIKFVVLAEAGYKCGNPTCRNVLALELHHIVWVREGGGNQPENLLPLCGHCHGLHTCGHIPAGAIRVWKAALTSLNSANRGAADMLLHFMRMAENPDAANSLYTAGDLLHVVPLINAGLLSAQQVNVSGPAFLMTAHNTFFLQLTAKGRDFVQAWRKGDAAGLTGSLDHGTVQPGGDQF